MADATIIPSQLVGQVLFVTLLLNNKGGYVPQVPDLTITLLFGDIPNIFQPLIGVSILLVFLNVTLPT